MTKKVPALLGGIVTPTDKISMILSRQAWVVEADLDNPINMFVPLYRDKEAAEIIAGPHGLGKVIEVMLTFKR